MSYQRLTNFSNSLSIEEIAGLRQKIQSSIAELNVKKLLINSNDYQSLINHLEFVLNIYNTMLTAKKLNQSAGPVCSFNPYQAQQTVVYSGDGSTTTIVDERDVVKSEEWRDQFEQNVHNPPMYALPPMGIWDINRIKNINMG